MLDFHKNCAHHETWTMNMSKKKVLYHRGLSHFFRGLQSIAPYTRHPKSSACHAESSSCPKSNSTTVSQNAIFNPFKTSSKFTKYCACHTKWRPKAPLILTPANVLATCRKCHACHTKWTQPKKRAQLANKTRPSILRGLCDTTALCKPGRNAHGILFG